MSSSPCIVRCGTAGWSYPSWNTAVYPKPKPRGFHPLEFLSERFDTVEVNSTFYRAVRPEIARLWLSRVAANRSFRFTVKLAKQFTHERELSPADVDAWKEGPRVLRQAGRLGCVLMQFPWSFKFSSENREYLIHLRRTFAEFPLAAEFRHASWMREEALGVLIDYRVGFVNLDQPVYEKAMPATAFLTSPIGYVRLLGREGRPEQPSVPRNTYLYSPEELAAWRERIERVRMYAESVYVSFANDGRGRAVTNARQLCDLLGSARVQPAAQQALFAA
ncbi:MAG: DUF72 domain-containing protein [Bryobacteraceae bacterium]|nr:DUF72 domain-containing protein [Bryobacteraceae bacterium]